MQFQNDPKVEVFLLSMKAAAVGLTLGRGEVFGALPRGVGERFPKQRLLTLQMPVVTLTFFSCFSSSFFSYAFLKT